MLFKETLISVDHCEWRGLGWMTSALFQWYIELPICTMGESIIGHLWRTITAQITDTQIWIHPKTQETP